ncbi:MAG: hypothetical protein ACRC4L_00795 [Mycoplasma sp.]
MSKSKFSLLICTEGVECKTEKTFFNCFNSSFCRFIFLNAPSTKTSDKGAQCIKNQINGNLIRAGEMFNEGMNKNSEDYIVFVTHDCDCKDQEEVHNNAFKIIESIFREKNIKVNRICIEGKSFDYFIWELSNLNSIFNNSAEEVSMDKILNEWKIKKEKYVGKILQTSFFIENINDENLSFSRKLEKMFKVLEQKYGENYLDKLSDYFIMLKEIVNIFNN